MRRVVVIVLVLGVVREGRRLVCQAGGVTRPSHSAAEISICNTQQLLPTSYLYFAYSSPISLKCTTSRSPLIKHHSPNFSCSSNRTIARLAFSHFRYLFFTIRSRDIRLIFLRIIP